ncbi:MAG: hypothetical protein ACN4E2_02505 [Nitrospinota bacterium]
MSRVALFIFIIISTFTIACGSSSSDVSYPDIAGEYIMEKDGYTSTCTDGTNNTADPASGVPVAITQSGNKFTAKYFHHNPDTNGSISNWTQDCSIETDGNFTCTEEYDFQGTHHAVLTIEGSFTTGGMVGLMRETVNFVTFGFTCDTGEEGFGISLTN